MRSSIVSGVNTVLAGDVVHPDAGVVVRIPVTVYAT
jgi:hypothetical protein